MENIKEQFKKGKNGRLFILFIILIIVLILLLSRCSCDQSTNNHQPITNNANTGANSNANTDQGDLWPDLSGCSTGMLVDYHSTVKTTNETEAGEIFKEYISWAQMNHKEVFPEKGNRWQFQSAAPHGIYQGVKYWKITALWFSQTKQQWLPQIVFDVNANGQVIRLLGCL